SFNLPDLTSRFIYGSDAAASNLNAKGGETDHTLIPAEGAVRDHQHHMTSNNLGGTAFSTIDLGSGRARIASSNGAASAGGVHVMGAVAGSNFRGFGVGGVFGGALNGAPHNNMPPYIVLAQIIKVTGAAINPGGALVGPTGPAGSAVAQPRCAVR